PEVDRVVLVEERLPDRTDADPVVQFRITDQWPRRLDDVPGVLLDLHEPRNELGFVRANRRRAGLETDVRAGKHVPVPQPPAALSSLAGALHEIIGRRPLDSVQRKHAAYVRRGRTGLTGLDA